MKWKTNRSRKNGHSLGKAYFVKLESIAFRLSKSKGSRSQFVFYLSSFSAQILSFLWSSTCLQYQQPQTFTAFGYNCLFRGFRARKVETCFFGLPSVSWETRCIHGFSLCQVWALHSECQGTYALLNLLCVCDMQVSAWLGTWSVVPSWLKVRTVLHIWLCLTWYMGTLPYHILITFLREEKTVRLYCLFRLYL